MKLAAALVALVLGGGCVGPFELWDDRYGTANRWVYDQRLDSCGRAGELTKDPGWVHCMTVSEPD